MKKLNVYASIFIIAMYKFENLIIRGQDAAIASTHRSEIDFSFYLSFNFLEFFNSFQDCVQGGIWQRTLLALLVFALIVRSELPKGVASNFDRGKP